MFSWSLEQASKIECQRLLNVLQGLSGFALLWILLDVRLFWEGCLVFSIIRKLSTWDYSNGVQSNPYYELVEYVWHWSRHVVKIIGINRPCGTAANAIWLWPGSRLRPWSGYDLIADFDKQLEKWSTSRFRLPRITERPSSSCWWLPGSGTLGSSSNLMRNTIWHHEKSVYCLCFTRNPFPASFSLVLDCHTGHNQPILTEFLSEEEFSVLCVHCRFKCRPTILRASANVESW
jgi:hypothetical protein